MWGLSKILGGAPNDHCHWMIQWSEVGNCKRPKRNKTIYAGNSTGGKAERFWWRWLTCQSNDAIHVILNFFLSLGHDLSWNAQVIPNPEGASNASLKLSIAMDGREKCDSDKVAALYGTQKMKTGRWCSFQADETISGSMWIWQKVYRINEQIQRPTSFASDPIRLTRSAYESSCLANFCSNLCSFVWSEDQLLEMLKQASNFAKHSIFG